MSSGMLDMPRQSAIFFCIKIKELIFVKKAIYVILAALLVFQGGIFLTGCSNGSGSSSSTSQMAGKSALSIVVKDRATGAKLPMTGVFINSASLAGASGLRTSSTSASWEETKTNNMGYAAINNVSPDATVMIKVVNGAGSYEEYSQVINTGKNFGGYTVYLTTNESAAPPTVETYDPANVSAGGPGTVYSCTDATCMQCGCNPAGGSSCGAGCGCASGNCGGQCRTAAGVSSFGQCNNAGCPPGCKNCGACACTAGNCGGSANCAVAVRPGGNGTSAGSGGCSDSACPPGCTGCGGCVCNPGAGGCGGSSHCTGSTTRVSFEATPGGSGKCTDGSCPAGCRNCGACACASGNCGGSANCVSGGSSGGGGTPAGGGGGIVGCQGSGCPQSCATNPCHACSCAAGTGKCGGSSHCLP